jgi:hypothetical protein
MKNRLEIFLIVYLFVFTGLAFCRENQEKNKGQQKEDTLFTSVDDAFSVLLDENSELQLEASDYLKKHPANAIAKLEQLIEKKNPQWFIAMYTLTDIGGESVIRFYCDLLNKNRYEMDENGKRIIYGLGSPNGCEKPRYFYGESIVTELGRLGDKAADSCLQCAWLDSDDDVKAVVPKARYDIGALALNDLKKLVITDILHKDTYLNTLLAIAQDCIHTKTDTAIQIFEKVCAMPESGNQIRASAHMPLIQCYELKKDYDKALSHCDWIIDNSEEKDWSSRCRVRRSMLLFHQGKLNQDELFELAKKDNEYYDPIAQLGRFRDTTIFDRIIKEAPIGSKYIMEAQYWKLEYFDETDMPERAKSQAEFILQTCKDEDILKWVQKRSVREKEITDRISRNKAR